MPLFHMPNRRFVWGMLLAGLMTISNVLAPAARVFAQSANAPVTDDVRLEEPDFTRLPPALLKPVPESISDLLEIEERVQSLVAKITACTVALQVGAAQGSGVLVSADGYVLTAAHVSGEPGHRISVRLPDGSHAFGRTLGRNRTLDASLIKIDTPERSWPHLKMADLSELKNGTWCLVTGHPGGYQSGRPPVVRLGRVIHSDSRVIQTDCELVGGDSGGPLFDLKGEVIGINSRIGEDTSFNLHVPVSVYTDAWDKLVASESFSVHSGAFLGVQGEDTEQGVRLTKVWPDQPAAQAGMNVGDILLTFQSAPVKSMDDLFDLVGDERPGRRVTVTLLRDQEVIEMTLRLGIREEE